MGVQMADDGLDEVSCGAVASHVSSPDLAGNETKWKGNQAANPACNLHPGQSCKVCIQMTQGQRVVQEKEQQMELR